MTGVDLTSSESVSPLRSLDESAKADIIGLALSPISERGNEGEVEEELRQSHTRVPRCGICEKRVSRKIGVERIHFE